MSRAKLQSDAKYKILAERTRREIESGTLRPGDRLSSFSEMREQFGATPTTVQRVYALLESEGLIVREHGRGVFVAAPQAPPSSGVIGVTGLKDNFMSHPWNMHLLSGARQAAESTRKEILLLNPHSVIRWEKIDGVLNLEPAFEDAGPRLPPGIPFVSALTAVKNRSNVVADEAGGVCKAMQHLLALGHRRIAYLISYQTPDVKFLRPRVEAYQNSLRDAGIKANQKWLRHLKYRDSYRESGWRDMAQWLREDWAALDCTALLAQNDDTAIGAMQALREADLQIPHDVSVIGFDGTELGEYCTPHLTSVEMPLREIGRRAVESLLQQMKHEEETQNANRTTLILPTRFKLRASTASPKAF